MEEVLCVCGLTKRSKEQLLRVKQYRSPQSHVKDCQVPIVDNCPACKLDRFFRLFLILQFDVALKNCLACVNIYLLLVKNLRYCYFIYCFL